MIDRFELLGEVLKEGKDKEILYPTMEVVLNRLRRQLHTDLEIYFADFGEIHEWSEDIAENDSQDIRRWVLLEDGAVSILYGTEFLAKIYAIKSHDWISETLPVLMASETEFRNPCKCVFLQQWLEEEYRKFTENAS